MQNSDIHKLIIQLEQAKNIIHYTINELKKRGIDPTHYEYQVQDNVISLQFQKKKNDYEKQLLLSRMNKYKE